MFVVLTGLVAGFLHVLQGPDHLAAVAPLAARGHRGAWVPGARWGLGHAAGVLLVGLAAYGIRSILPPAALSSWSERLVGVLLIGMAVWSARRAMRIEVHAHEHEHDGSRHGHVHLHGPGHVHGDGHTGSAHGHRHAAFGIGILHGLAGGSHFLGVLPSLALPRAWQTAAYLVAFAAGTVLAMAGFSAALGTVAARSAGRAPGLYRGLVWACTAAAFAVGGWWIVAAVRPA
jgi:hypothetical protein